MLTRISRDDFGAVEPQKDGSLQKAAQTLPPCTSPREIFAWPASRTG